MDKKLFSDLITYIKRIPGIYGEIGFGDNEGLWWVKLSIDLNSDLAWRVVQELGHIINFISINDRLPTVFYPVSPPPYMNGGPNDFLSWIIETYDREFTPSLLLEFLEGRLPSPVDDINEWNLE